MLLKPAAWFSERGFVLFDMLLNNGDGARRAARG